MLTVQSDWKTIFSRCRIHLRQVVCRTCALVPQDDTVFLNTMLVLVFTLFAVFKIWLQMWETDPKFLDTKRYFVISSNKVLDIVSLRDWVHTKENTVITFCLRSWLPWQQSSRFVLTWCRQIPFSIVLPSALFCFSHFSFCFCIKYTYRDNWVLFSRRVNLNSLLHDIISLSFEHYVCLRANLWRENRLNSTSIYQGGHEWKCWLVLQRKVF